MYFLIKIQRRRKIDNWGGGGTYSYIRAMHKQKEKRAKLIDKIKKKHS